MKASLTFSANLLLADKKGHCMHANIFLLDQAVGNHQLKEAGLTSRAYILGVSS